MAQPELIANRFAVGDMIGRGGMGEVFHGLDTQTETPVAVKVLKSEYILRNPEAVERFQREGEALRVLNHPNIVKVLATARQDNHHYIVMEYVEGGTLADLMGKQPQLPVQRVLSIALELADALTRAHHLKIIHRDIKPANVLLAQDGTPRLTDFGVAQTSDSNLTAAGVTVGTFAYLSPEACQGEAVDVRTDIWSFGVLLYEMLAGQPPFNESHPAAILTAVLTKPIPDIEALRGGIPVGLVDLIYRMLEKNREARIPRMRMVGAELEGIIDGLDTSSRPVGMTNFTTGQMRFIVPVLDDTPTASTPSRVVPPHSLPAFSTPLIGREPELAELGQRLIDPKTRLVTLVGSGGMGKTRLAVAAAEQNLVEFTHGVFYVPLASVSDASFIPTTVAEHLKFAFSGAAEPKQQLLDYLREKQMLIILDNYEHLIASAAMITDVLHAAPNITLLVVSRERLRLQNELVFELNGMVLPEGETLDELASYLAVQLFVESARRANPGFEATEDNIRLIAHCCWLVDGLPLGIELAAAWLEALPLEEVVKEIEQSLDFLETDLRDVPERHRSLRAVFDSSWNLMSDEERDVLMKLSVFRSGFTREAAQQVANASLRILTTLVNKSVLRRAPDGRYTPHVTLRQYAAEQFERDVENTAAVRYAHATFFADFMIKQEKLFNTKREKMGVDEVEKEIENVRAAWRWALESQEWAILQSMLQPLTGYYFVRALLREGRQLFGELCDYLEAAGQGKTPLWWQAWRRHGWMAGRLGDYALIYSTNEASLRYFRQQGDQQECGYALNGLSYACMMQGRYDESRQYAREALQIAREIKRTELILISMGNWGYAEYLANNLDEARRLYEEYNAIVAKDGSPISHAFGLNNLGEILWTSVGDAESKRLYEEAYGIFKSFGHRQGMAFTLNNLGGVLLGMGEYGEAEKHYRQAYELHREIGDRAGTGHSLSAIGNVALSAMKYDEAKRAYQESLQLRREIGDPRSIADSLTDLALVASLTGKLEEAGRLYEESFALRREIGDDYGGISALVGAGNNAAAMGDFATAYQYFERLKVFGEQTRNMGLQAWASSGIGSTQVSEGKLDEAGKTLRQALEASQSLNEVFLMLFTLLHIAILSMEQGKPAEALALLTLVWEYPVDLYSINKSRARLLIAQLKTQLAPQEFVAAQERGKMLELDEVVRTILAEGVQ